MSMTAIEIIANEVEEGAIVAKKTRWQKSDKEW